MPAFKSRLFALALLCLYGWCSTPMSSFVFATLAEWSSEHEVQVQWSPYDVRVVLHHPQAARPTLAATDHEQPLTRALSCLCAVDGQGDHVFDQGGETCQLLSASETSDRLAKSQPGTLIAIIDQSHHGHAQRWFSLDAQRRLANATATSSARPTMGLGRIALLI